MSSIPAELTSLEGSAVTSFSASSAQATWITIGALRANVGTVNNRGQQRSTLFNQTRQRSVYPTLVDTRQLPVPCECATRWSSGFIVQLYGRQDY